jgi:hypothetical protein
MAKAVNVFGGDDEFLWRRMWALSEHDNPISL